MLNELSSAHKPLSVTRDKREVNMSYLGTGIIVSGQAGTPLPGI